MLGFTGNSDGTYTVAYTIIESGPHSISVIIENVRISNRPSPPTIINEKELVTTLVNRQLSVQGQCTTSSEQREAYKASQSRNVAFRLRTSVVAWPTMQAADAPSTCR